MNNYKAEYLKGGLKGEKIKALRSILIDRKGKVFNDKVFDWLKLNHLNLRKKIKLPRKLGDIDVLGIDHNALRICLFESKNITSSKIPKEMAEEKNSYCTPLQC